MAGNKWPAQYGYGSPEPTYDRLETGVIEKLLGSYGFIRCCERQARIFFHYSHFDGSPEHLKTGNPVEFELSFDKKSGKPIAVDVRKITTEISTILGSQRVTGIVTAVLNSDGRGGCVAYEVQGECFFIEFNKKDLVNPNEKLTVNARVEFSISGEGSGYKVHDVQLVPTSPPAGQSQVPRKPVKGQPQQQQYMTSALAYPRMILTNAGNGNPMVYGMPPGGQALNQSGLNFPASSMMNGNIRTDTEAMPSQGRQGNPMSIGNILKPTSTNDLQLGQQKQQTGNVQHFSGQLTKLLDQQLRHSAAGQASSQGYNGTSQAHQESSRNGGQMRKSTADQNGAEKIARDQAELRYQGVVCSLKDSYGFIERADVVKEIFFNKAHAYENLALGDDVAFDILLRNDCEVAVNLRLLPPNTVKFYDIGNDLYRGIVIRPPNPEDEPSEGRLTYEEDGERKELAFTDRDLAPLSWAMRAGDPVDFQLATDVRDKVVRATNILYSINAPTAFSRETRLTGTVTALKDSFGFITASTPDKSEYYFKRYDILDNEVRLETFVQFTVEVLSDDVSSTGRRDPVAIRICRASSSKKKQVRKSAKCSHRGYIVALKEHFGFIEGENREEDLFFRYSVFDGDVNSLKIGDEVEYGLLAKTPRPSAECVRAIDNGTIPGVELISDEKFTGKILRSLRCFNPDQTSYCGLLQKNGVEKEVNEESMTEDDKKEDPNENHENEEYEFSVMSLAKPGEVMQKSDMVEFKLAQSKVTQKIIAVNVSLVREKKTATVDSIKGQVYYLNYEIDNGKKLSFLATEIKLAQSLSVGDVVEFDYIRGRNNKWSATNVRRVKAKEVTPRPQSLINRYKQLAVSDDGPKVIAIRQPRGPDGSRGFLLQAVSA